MAGLEHDPKTPLLLASSDAATSVNRSASTPSLVPDRRARKTGLAVVATVLFLDSMLLSCVVPILPAYLSKAGVSEWQIAILFSAKAAVQVVTTPFVPPVVRRFGTQAVLMGGTMVLIASSVGFAFGTTFAGLLAARAVQGIGSACAGCAGLTQVAQMFPEDELRGPSMATATMGLGVGVILGPPFGGVVYAHAGKQWPFFILALLGMCAVTVQGLLLSNPGLRRQIRRQAAESQRMTSEHPPPSIMTLLKDRNIRRCAVGLVAQNLTISAVEPTFPLWAEDQFGSSPQTVGLVFLAASLSFLLGTAVAGVIGLRVGRKAVSTGSLSLSAVGVAFLVWPGQRSNILQSIPALIAMGAGMGGCEASTNPILGAIAGNCFPQAESTVFALADMCFSTGFVIGPLLVTALFANHVAIEYVCAAGFMLTLAAAGYVATIDNRVCTEIDEESKEGRRVSLYEDEDDSFELS